MKLNRDYWLANLQPGSYVSIQFDVKTQFIYYPAVCVFFTSNYFEVRTIDKVYKVSKTGKIIDSPNLKIVPILNHWLGLQYEQYLDQKPVWFDQPLYEI